MKLTDEKQSRYLVDNTWIPNKIYDPRFNFATGRHDLRPAPGNFDSFLVNPRHKNYVLSNEEKKLKEKGFSIQEILFQRVLKDFYNPLMPASRGGGQF